MDRRDFSRIGEKMSKVYLCKGEYAESPFYIEKQRINLYSIEEVCYYIKENICLLDKAIMTPAFIRFIGEDCKLEAMEKELKTILHRKKSMADFCEYLLREEGRTEKEEIENLIENISKSESLDVFEKRKSNADYFVRKKKYLRGMIEYRKILEKADPNDYILRSEIFHNMGVIYANLYHFFEAKDYFLKAYEMGEREESLLCYLAAWKIGNEKVEDVEILDEKFSYQEQLFELNSLMKKIKEEWIESEIPGALLNPVYDVDMINRKERIEKMDHIVSEWKEEYRMFIEE